MKKFSALLVFVFAASLFAHEAPPAAPAAPAADHAAKPAAAPAKKKPVAAQKKAPAAHKPTTMVNPTEPTAAAGDKPVEGGEGN